MSDPVQEFMTAMIGAGLTPPDTIEADGRLHRFDSDGRKGKKTGWYVFHTDTPAAGVFGCWRQGFSQSWCSKSRDAMTEAERQAHRRRMSAMHRQREQETQDRHAEAKTECVKLWDASKPCPDGGHLYLTRKGIRPYGLHIMDKGDAARLLVPLRVGGELVSLQFIGADGSKRFMTGGRVQGAYCAIGELSGTPPVLVVCEGVATGASIHETTGLPVAVAFNAGNLKAVAQALREKMPAAKIIVAADDDVNTEDNPGLTKAREAAQAVGGLLAVPDFGAERPQDVSDFNDLHQLAGATALLRCFAAAEPAPSLGNAGADCWMPWEDTEAMQVSEVALAVASTWPEPQPLIAQLGHEEYPLDALPSMVQLAVLEVAGFVKAPAPLIATSALAALSLAIQAHVDVERAEKLNGPTGLFLLAVADSGERKSTCDGFFTRAIKDFEARRQEEMKPHIQDFKSAFTAWEAQRSGLKEKIKSLSRDGKPCKAQVQELHELDKCEPPPPKVPRLIYGDATPEALAYSLAKQWPSGGVVSSEAGSVFGSHGMGKESAMRNLAMLNQLWDGASLPIERRSTESFTVRGARLTMALQVQESTLRAFFDSTKGLARGTGFLARFLVSWPRSTQGTRHFTEAPDHWPSLAAFNNRLAVLLNQPVPMDEDSGGLTPAMLTLSPDAKAAWVDFHDAIEIELSTGGELHDVRDVASKTADNAARIAALFHTFTGGVGPIGLEAMESATRIAAWHLHEARRFLGELAMPAELANPMRLEAWMVEYCKREGVDFVPTREIQRCGPNGLRDKAVIDSAIKELSDLGRAKLATEGKKKSVRLNPALLEVTP